MMEAQVRAHFLVGRTTQIRRLRLVEDLKIDR